MEERGRVLILSYYPRICLGGLKKSQNISVRITGLWAEISTRDLQSTKQEC
jgi:hypothetical protein